MSYLVTFHVEVFNMEPDFNEMKKNFLENGVDYLEELQSETEEYEDEGDDFLDSMEDGEKKPKKKPKKTKINCYTFSEGSSSEYEELMTLIANSENSKTRYDLISDDIIFPSSFNMIRNVVKYKKYQEIKKEGVNRNAF